ncbi:Scr1 family TA system antitoxin-like transcriptional regulator [Streptomyces atratus]|uniref:Scr1 family TA system antitoxin-like transcriptional regulator n=1 Tax=Streptomyces atratus TaxID=1893 RepID=UPI0034100DF9
MGSRTGATRVRRALVRARDVPEVIILDALANCLILEEPEDMAGYVHAFDALRSAALTPNKSVSFIRKIMDGFTTENEEM